MRLAMPMGLSAAMLALAVAAFLVPRPVPVKPPLPEPILHAGEEAAMARACQEQAPITAADVIRREPMQGSVYVSRALQRELATRLASMPPKQRDEICRKALALFPPTEQS